MAWANPDARLGLPDRHLIHITMRSKRPLAPGTLAKAVGRQAWAP